VIHRVSFRAFAAATEDERRVQEALAIFVPMDSISIAKAIGHYGNEIKILEAALKRGEGLAFFQLLREQLPKEDLARLRREIPLRVDEECQFHLRLDKQAAYKGIVCLTDSRDAIDVSALIESYPARREKALRIVGELL
jgi:RNA binding exosome subunit